MIDVLDVNLPYSAETLDLIETACTKHPFPEVRHCVESLLSAGVIRVGMCEGRRVARSYGPVDTVILSERLPADANSGVVKLDETKLHECLSRIQRAIKD